MFVKLSPLQGTLLPRKSSLLCICVHPGVNPVATRTLERTRRVSCGGVYVRARARGIEGKLSTERDRDDGERDLQRGAVGKKRVRIEAK